MTIKYPDRFRRFWGWLACQFQMDNEVPQGQDDIRNGPPVTSTRNMEWNIANVRKDYDDLLKQEMNEPPPIEEDRQTFSNVPVFHQSVYQVYWQRWLMVGWVHVLFLFCQQYGDYLYVRSVKKKNYIMKLTKIMPSHY